MSENDHFPIGTSTNGEVVAAAIADGGVYASDAFAIGGKSGWLGIVRSNPASGEIGYLPDAELALNIEQCKGVAELIGCFDQVVAVLQAWIVAEGKPSATGAELDARLMLHEREG